jgi:hypothetical protein
MEEPIRFDLWGRVRPAVPTSAARWLLELRPALTELAARRLIAHGRLSSDPCQLLTSCSWPSVQAILGNLPDWIGDASVVQEGYAPSQAAHFCELHQLRYAGCLGCHVCRGFFAR